jgi:hypothetical protein
VKGIESVLEESESKDQKRDSSLKVPDSKVLRGLTFGTLCHVGTPIFINKDGTIRMIPEGSPKFFDFAQEVKWRSTAPVAGSYLPSIPDMVGESKARLLLDWALNEKGFAHLWIKEKVCSRPPATVVAEYCLFF